MFVQYSNHSTATHRHLIVNKKSPEQIEIIDLRESITHGLQNILWKHSPIEGYVCHHFLGVMGLGLTFTEWQKKYFSALSAHTSKQKSPI